MKYPTHACQAVYMKYPTHACPCMGTCLSSMHALQVFQCFCCYVVRNASCLINIKFSWCFETRGIAIVIMIMACIAVPMQMANGTSSLHDRSCHVMSCHCIINICCSFHADCNGQVVLVDQTGGVLWSECEFGKSGLLCCQFPNNHQQPVSCTIPIPSDSHAISCIA